MMKFVKNTALLLLMFNLFSFVGLADLSVDNSANVGGATGVIIPLPPGDKQEEPADDENSGDTENSGETENPGETSDSEDQENNTEDGEPDNTEPGNTETGNTQSGNTESGNTVSGTTVSSGGGSYRPVTKPAEKEEITEENLMSGIMLH